MKIGLFGGSFDPVHNTHIKIAQESAKRYNIDKIIFIPAKNPPHREKKNPIDPRYRLDMLNLAIRGRKDFTLSDFEIKRERVTYTADTIKHFRKKFPDDEIFFIIGADALAEIPHWKKGMGLLKMCKFIVAQRPSVKISGKYDVLYLKDVNSDISSSYIRKNIYLNNVSKFMPPGVYSYVRKNYLYLDECIKEYLKKRLDSAKYKHTIGAADVAVKLAKTFGADPRKTLIASLLHDLGRIHSISSYEAYLNENKLHFKGLEEIERKNPFLLHSFISADMSKKIFKIKDTEILNAIKNHTFGAPKYNATLYDKIIYVSDTIAPDRRFKNISGIRNVAYRNINKAMFLCSAIKMHYIIKKGKWLAPQSVAVYNSYRIYES